MKHILIFLLLISSSLLFAQPGKKPAEKKPTQSEMDKQMEDAMKGMTEEEKVEMRKLMKGIMPELNDKAMKMADYPDFSTNKELIPKKDLARIAAIPKKKLAQADVSGYASTLYNKIMTKGEAAEVALVKSVILKAPKAIDMANASVIAMMQGHPQAAMALSMKAVQLDPANVTMQNNMASLLTQYGYPEQAIPVLDKLKKEFPANSTVLNNLGQAWFDLGELDSAKKITGQAIRANPFHPEAKVCGGLIEEITGDPVKAEKDYTEAMENAPNPIIEKILKNKTGNKGSEKIDFEKLKRSITIYEYFPKNWITIPRLSDNVSGYENDMRIKNGYEKMFEELKAKIQTLLEASNAEVSKLMEKGETEFAKSMGTEALKGLNVMSKTAVTVQFLLQQYIAKWAMDNAKDYTDLLNTINTSRTEMTKSGNNDKCADFDRKNNRFLEYINPKIRAFHEKKIEEFRTWLNAYCTWVWYIAGNPKNSIMTTCIAWTEALEELYDKAINDQQAKEKSCVSQNSNGTSLVPPPEIPNFSCPTLIKVPLGKDWQELGNTVKNFDANSLGIKNSSNPIPNHTSSFAGGTKSIAQPGKSPFVKTANGSVSPGMINESDNELTPLSKIPLDDLTPLPDLQRSKLLKDLLNKMMTADCKNIKSTKDKLKEQLDRMMKGVKELEAYENVIEQIKKLEAEIEQKETDARKKEDLKNKIKQMQTETDKMDKYEQVQQSKKEIESIIKEMEAMDDKKFMKEMFDKIMQSVDEMEAAPAIIKDIQQNGLQASISSGIQVPGTFTPVKGLFN